MPLVSVVPDLVSQASGDLANIGSTLHRTVTAAANQTTAIAAPASDEVSAAITALFASHAQEFQTLNARATIFHSAFVNLLNGGAAKYLNTEVANAEQTAINAVNTPAHAAAQGTGTTNSSTTVTRNYGPITVTTTSSSNSATFNAYIGTRLGNLSLLSANYYESPNSIGPSNAPLTPFDYHLGFLNNGFGWTLSGLPTGKNTFEYSFYATNFWATDQGFYLTQPISGTGRVVASILENYGLLGPTGVSFISQSGSPFVPWLVFDGSPVFPV